MALARISWPSGVRRVSSTAVRNASWNFLLVRKASNMVPPSPPEDAAATGFTARLGAGTGAGSSRNAPSIQSDIWVVSLVSPRR